MLRAVFMLKVFYIVGISAIWSTPIAILYIHGADLEFDKIYWKTPISIIILYACMATIPIWIERCFPETNNVFKIMLAIAFMNLMNAMIIYAIDLQAISSQHENKYATAMSHPFFFSAICAFPLSLMGKNAASLAR